VYVCGVYQVHVYMSSVSITGNMAEYPLLSRKADMWYMVGRLRVCRFVIYYAIHSKYSDIGWLLYD